MNRKPNHKPETAHQRSIKKPRNQALLLRLRRYWNRWDHIQRGQSLAELKRGGCSLRGLAKDIGKVSAATLAKYIRLASLSEEDRDALRHGETEKRVLAKIAARKRLQETTDRIVQDSKTHKHSTELANIVLDFFRTEDADVHPSAIDTIIQCAKQRFHNPLPFPRPTVIKLPRRLSRAELFKLTKPQPEWREDPHEIGFIQRWLETIVASVEPEQEIRDRGMNMVQARWRELVPEVTPAEQQRRQEEHYRRLYEGPHTQH